MFLCQTIFCCPHVIEKNEHQVALTLATGAVLYSARVSCITYNWKLN